MDASEFKRFIERKIERTNRKINNIEESQGPNPGQTHTYWGGWDLGYWKGRLSVLEDISELIEGDSE